ncbi:hypothetical protein INR49_019401 [Caranx melampygus]|nr:hypothetical protein INR49_019401 [Caranx melampygus]
MEAKFMEGGVESDYADDSSLYYSQQSMFPPTALTKMCSGVSHAWYEQQRGASVKSKWAQPVCQPALQSCQHAQRWHNAHTSFAEQVQHTPRHTTPGGNSSRAVKCFWNSTPPPAANAPSETGILPMSSRSVLNHSQQVGGPTGQAGGMGGVGVERGGWRRRRRRWKERQHGSPSRSSPSIIGMPKQQQARQAFTINRRQRECDGSGLSDFPALADRSRRDGGSNPTPLLNPLAGRAPYVSRLLTALSSMSPVGMVTKPSSEQSQDFSIHNEDFPALPGPNYQTKDPHQHQRRQQNGRVTNIRLAWYKDQFGMIGLLTFIRAAENRPGHGPPGAGL